jgi:Spy/CpxP family protein refolding chaperone
MTKMRNVLVSVMVLMMAATFAVAADAPARRRGGSSRGGRSRSSLLGLLSLEQVQKELKIQKADVAKIKAVSDKLRADMRKQYPELRKIKDSAKRRAKYAELRAQYDSNSRKQLQDVLSREQMIRLYQIRSQNRAVTETLASKYVAEKLKLTADQKTKIAKVGADSQTKRYAIYRTMRDADEKKRTAARKKLGEISAEADKAALELLTKEQKKAFEKMKGKKFEIKRTPRTRTTT